MSGPVANNIFRASGVVAAAAGGLNWNSTILTALTTFTVTVANAGGNKYFIDGVQQQTVNLLEGFTYKFDQADSSNSGHPLRFSTTSNGSHGGGSEYTTGVTTSGTPGSSGAYTQIVVAADAPTLYYYCTAHSNMGGQANTVVSYVPVSSGKGYWINTTSDAATIKLPSSAEVGDQFIFGDYARTWATNAITIDSNGLNFQGEPDTFTVDYDTNGQAINIVYSGATKGWTPVSDIAVALEAIAPATQKGLFGFGEYSSRTGITNLISSSGVVATDTAGVGTGRSVLAAATYGGEKGIIGYGTTGSNTNLSNLVSTSGVVASDTTGVGTARLGLAAAAYGGDKAIFGYGNTSSPVSLTNLVANNGVIAADTTGVGTARNYIAATAYGGDKAIFGYGATGSADTTRVSLTNKVANNGVVASDTTGVGTARLFMGAAGYGSSGQAIFGYGGYYDGSMNLLSVTNLVSNTGVVSADVTGVGTARRGLAATRYGGDKAIFGFGSSNTSVTNKISNSGVAASDTTGVGTGRNDICAVGFSYSG